MAQAVRPSPVLLFLGIMYRTLAERDDALARFCHEQGCTLLDSVDATTFSDISSYYDNEMGGEVYKAYYLFETPIDRAMLSRIKVFTNSLEEQFLSEGGRQINLDPGYVTKDKLVLASAKDFAHRLYIGDGIYAEVTLHFTEKGPRYFSWTYEDYKDDRVQELLLKGRSLLLS